MRVSRSDAASRVGPSGSSLLWRAVGRFGSLVSALAYVAQRHRDALVLALGALFVRIAFFSGCWTWDQFAYAADAYRLLVPAPTMPLMPDGWAGWTEASTRWGIQLPAAAAFAVFGVGDASAALYPMLCSIGNVVVVYALAREAAGPSAGRIAAAIQCVFPLDVAYATQLMTDVPISFWLSLACLLLLRSGRLPASRRAAILSIAAGACFAMAYGLKFVALLTAPAFALLAVAGARPASRLLAFGAGAAAVASLEAAVSFVLTGDALYRLRVILQEGAFQAADFQAGHFGSLYTSLWAYPEWLLLTPRWVGPTFMVFGVALLVRLPSLSRLPRGMWWLLLWSLVVAVTFSVYPISSSPYVPLNKQSNYMLLFTAPAIAAGGALVASFARGPRLLLLAVLLGGGALFSLVEAEHNRSATDNARSLLSFWKEHPRVPIVTSLRSAYELKFRTAYRADNVFSFDGYLNAAAVGGTGRVYVAMDLDAMHVWPQSSPAWAHEAAQRPPSHWKRVRRFGGHESPLTHVTLFVVRVARQWGLLPPADAERSFHALHDWFHDRPLDLYEVGPNP